MAQADGRNRGSQPVIAAGVISGRRVAADCVSLLKPPSVVLLVITAVAAMPMAINRVPDLLLLLSVMVGGTLVAAGPLL